MCRPKIVARVSVIGICVNSQRSQGILKIRMLFYSLKILFISCSTEYFICVPKLITKLSHIDHDDCNMIRSCVVVMLLDVNLKYSSKIWYSAIYRIAR